MLPDSSCINFIKSKEGFRLKAYKDSAGIWTIGYGTIQYADHTPVKKGDTITLAIAEELISNEIITKSKAVNAAVSPTVINQNQFSALVSFAFNVGIGALKISALLKKVKANPADTSIRTAFMMWDKVHKDGKLIEVEGLKKEGAKKQICISLKKNFYNLFIKR